MEKYIGNKSTLLPLIETFIHSRSIPSTSISDVFCGTANTARYFKGRGWRTAANDANRFSYVLSRAYLGAFGKLAYPQIIAGVSTPFLKKRMMADFSRSLSRYGKLYSPNDSPESIFEALEGTANTLCYLQEIGDANRRPGIITQYFTVAGSKSKFTSSRGGTGQRNYFSTENALILDGILAKLRDWYRSGSIGEDELFMVLASVIEEVVIVANVSGTFHDFNRSKLWPNAKQRFQLRLPHVSSTAVPTEITNFDATIAARSLDYCDVAYLDPPYNFRQYSAYYHFLNFVSAYPFLQELDEYVGGLAFVRGQNPTDDFSSTFSSKKTFIPSLRELVGSLNSKHVILSYFSGRNHWNHWEEVAELNDEGLRALSDVFADPALFSRCEVIPVLEIRKNYQSRVGEKKSLVNEYLFYGEKKGLICGNSDKAVPLKANATWQLDGTFRPYRSRVNTEKKGISVSPRVGGISG